QTTIIGNPSLTFSSSTDQPVPLSAQVSSTAGSVDEGIVTFTIKQGGVPVGSPVVANVSGNSASGTYTLLHGTPGGVYTIEAVYTDPRDFNSSIGTRSLTVSAASTTIAPADAAAAFSVSAGEGVTLSANVNSPAGTVDGGSVTFKIQDGTG